MENFRITGQYHPSIEPTSSQRNSKNIEALDKKGPSTYQQSKSILDSLPKRTSTNRPDSISSFRKIAVLNGICSSQPRVNEHSYLEGSSSWAVHRTAPFVQGDILEHEAPGHAGACVIYSFLWMNKIAKQSGNASSRMNSLSQSTTEVLQLHQEYANRVFQCNNDPDNQEDPLIQTARALGVSPAGNTIAVDILTDEEAAMTSLSEILNRPGTSNIIWLGNVDPNSASNHLIASHATGGRVVLFDPNMGEFRLKLSEVPVVMREIVARSSMHFAVPELFILPMRA
ncbi:YopT-type cysteine protease domain-containing protein [Collimonas fungivorans]|uniref:YopT-type cysteine protease domain-containing protein n=1 Tax=Collimonas fungivorans TaxID=158899 RepID=UPI0009ED77E5|nr:YopT-type cysteine protease domain-containing protein [Collimonas fungivorans]